MPFLIVYFVLMFIGLLISPFLVIGVMAALFGLWVIATAWLLLSDRGKKYVALFDTWYMPKYFAAIRFFTRGRRARQQ